MWGCVAAPVRDNRGVWWPYLGKTAPAKLITKRKPAFCRVKWKKQPVQNTKDAYQLEANQRSKTG